MTKIMLGFCMSLRAKRSNPGSERWLMDCHVALNGLLAMTGCSRLPRLLTKSRNESYALRTYQVLLCKTCGNDREKMDCHADLYFANAKYGEKKKTVIFVLWHEDLTRQSLSQFDNKTNCVIIKKTFDKREFSDAQSINSIIVSFLDFYKKIKDVVSLFKMQIYDVFFCLNGYRVNWMRDMVCEHKWLV